MRHIRLFIETQVSRVESCFVLGFRYGSGDVLSGLGTVTKCKGLPPS